MRVYCSICALTVACCSPNLGNLHILWTNFAKLYEHHKDLDSARKVFERATLIEFRQVKDLAAVWCAYVEFELRHGEKERALRVVQQAISESAISCSLLKLLLFTNCVSALHLSAASSRHV